MTATTGESSARAPALAGWVGGVCLIVLCALAYVPGLFSIPPVDRDESRFAQASKQMAAGDSLRDWVVPMVGDTPRLNKPPIIYWLQAGVVRAAGADQEDQPLSFRARSEGESDAPDSNEPVMNEHRTGVTGPSVTRSSQATTAARDAVFDPTGGIGWYRIPSALCALIAALATWRLGLAMFGARHARTAWLSGVLLACSLIVMWDARQARADQLLLAVTTLALWALWRLWRSASVGDHVPWSHVIALWAAIGVGIMSKGPITPMIVLLTAVALSAATGRWKWMLRARPFVGVLIVIACVLPWVLLVVRAVGWDEYSSILHDEVLGRSISPSEGHWGPPGYHLVLLPLMFWPGSLLTAAGIVLAWKQARRSALAPGELPPGPGRVRRWLARFSDQRPAELFLLSWLVPSWVVFELVSTKLPHYTMPLYPALALLSARAVMVASSDAAAPAAMGLRSLGARLGFVIWLTLGLTLAVAAPVGLARLGGLGGDMGLRMFLGAMVGCGSGCIIVAARALWTGACARAQYYGVAAMLQAGVASFGFVLPNLHQPWVSPRLAQIIADADPEGTRSIGAVGYHEDSLKFLTHGRLDRLGWPAVRPWLDEHPRGLLVLPSAGFEDMAREAGLSLRVLGRTSGFNYSKGDPVDAIIAERAE